MTELPKEGEPLPPLIEAFQQLKYSTDDNSPNDLAKNYKEDGLFQFKLKKYRIATTCFSEAIRHAENKLNEEPDATLTSQLYNNRAAAQFHVGNYRSALQDCDKALSLKPDYTKPLMKALECCVKLERWEKALDYCNVGDKIAPQNAEVDKIRRMAKQKLV
jgi:tetratricopeptide (TPR) repeat protein